jgi:hypothetical protein
VKTKESKRTRRTVIASFKGSLRKRVSALAANATLLRAFAANAFFDGVRIFDSGFRLMLNTLLTLNSLVVENALNL